MKKLFTEVFQKDEDTVVIKGNDYHHIVNVLRYESGSKLIICDGNGNEYKCIIKMIQDKSVICRIIDEHKSNAESELKLSLFQSIPKSSKMDYIIQKSVEIGIKTIIPVITGRTIVRFKDENDMRKKRGRWDKISREASNQCGRGIIPHISMPVNFLQALDMGCKSDISLIPWEGEKSRTLKQTLTIDADIKSISLFVGPEGGFTEKEIHQAQERGIISVSLGPRILRTETAGIVISAIVMYQYGDIGGIS